LSGFAVLLLTAIFILAGYWNLVGESGGGSSPPSSEPPEPPSPQAVTGFNLTDYIIAPTVGETPAALLEGNPAHSTRAVSRGVRAVCSQITNANGCFRSDRQRAHCQVPRVA
jgi:hypothetical protein